MKAHIHHNIFVLLFLFMGLQSRAQNCENSIQDAMEQYKSGDINSCVSVIEACLSSYHSSEEKLAAYRLLALSYQSLHNDTKLEYYVRKLLREEPKYFLIAQSQDPKEFINYLNKFEVSPALNVFVSSGVGVSNPRVLKNNLGYPQAKSYYSSTYNAFLHFGLTKDIDGKSRVSTTLGVRGQGIEQRIELSNGAVQRYSETMEFLDFRLDYSYGLDLFNSASLFLDLGLGGGYLFGDQMFIELEEFDLNRVTQNSRNGLDFRRRLQPHVTFGASWEKPIYTGSLRFGMHYLYNLNPINRKDRTYIDESFNFSTHYVHDQLRINSLVLNISYSYPISYKVLKRKL